MVWCGMVSCSMVWYDVVWCGMVWCGMVSCGMVWYSIIWYGNGTYRSWYTSLVNSGEICKVSKCIHHIEIQLNHNMNYVTGEFSPLPPPPPELDDESYNIPPNPASSAPTWAPENYDEKGGVSIYCSYKLFIYRIEHQRKKLDLHVYLHNNYLNSVFVEGVIIKVLVCFSDSPRP